jgi:hypothetical protein
VSVEGIHNLGLFVVSGLLLNITPGADALIVARGTTQSARWRRRRARYRGGLHRARWPHARPVGDHCHVGAAFALVKDQRPIPRLSRPSLLLHRSRDDAAAPPPPASLRRVLYKAFSQRPGAEVASSSSRFCAKFFAADAPRKALPARARSSALIGANLFVAWSAGGRRGA